MKYEKEAIDFAEKYHITIRDEIREECRLSNDENIPDEDWFFQNLADYDQEYYCIQRINLPAF